MSAAPADPMARLSALDDVAAAMSAARDGMDALLRDRGRRRTPPALTGESLLRGAHASAVLAGSGSSLQQVRAGAGDQTAQAALRVATQVLGLAPVLSRSPLQAFARLHAVAGADASAAQDRLGRPRSPEAADRLAGLSRVLLSPTTAPALLVAAVVHAEVATAAPFDCGNGIVARAAERLVLVVRGVDATSLVVPEAGHLALRGSYEANLRRYAEDGSAGVRSWLLHAAEAFAAGTEASPLRDG